MGVKEGYKQTEIGVIPEDWTICEIGALNPFITSGSRGWAEYYADQGDAFIRITNLIRSSIYLDTSDLKYVNLPPESREGIRTALQNGDVLISITADIGIIGFVNESIPKPAYINQHIALARFDPNTADSRFISYFLASATSQKRFQSLTDQGAKAGMNLPTVKQIQTVLPPISEQRAIATVLSDTDALIAAQEALIAKKRTIKQGAMQQLLTGRKRLPGFKGEWEVKRLGDLASMSSGGTPSSSVTSNYGGSIPWASISDMTQGGKWLADTERKLTLAGLNNSAAKVFKAPVLLYAMYASIGECCLCSFEIATSQAILGINVSPSLSLEYLFYWMIQQKEEIKTLGQQGTQSNLNKQIVQDFELALPSYKEQQAIAAVLSDMDAEIEALQTQLGKTRALKQGMMQELLTGRIRLLETVKGAG